MYNEQQKRRFLEDITESSRIKTEATFNRTGPYEEKLGIDCGSFTVQEILDCLKQINTPAINTLRNVKSGLSVYADWCKEQNLLPDGINHYREISQQNLLDCMSNEKIEEGYLSKAEVYNVASSLENPLESVAILLAYEGFLFANYDACYTLSTSDLDGNILTVGDKRAEASADLIEYMKEAEAADNYILRRPDEETREMKFRSNWPPIFKQLYNNVRPYDTMEQRRHFFERLFRRIRGYTGERFITIKKLNESGRINALKSFMAAEGVLTGKESPEEKIRKIRGVFMKHKKELDLKYGEILEVGRFFKQHESIFTAE